MRMKLRDVRTGSTFDTSYCPEEKFEQSWLSKLFQLNTLVQNGWYSLHFMNTETYDQYEIPVVNVEQELLYILKTRSKKIQSTEAK